jgi:phytoene/squalene synthetase
MIDLFHRASENCSRVVTERYSTSFSSAIRLLHKDLRTPVFNIYGFVRFADEIVDTFHDFNKAELLEEFKKETYGAIERGISCNPILNSFQCTVNKYQIDHSLIEAFFHSMKMDLTRQRYDEDKEYREYIYGSAEVVGLMCLTVFCEGRKDVFEQLKPHARSLGAAFQKVNFLRDIKADYNGLSRIYFPCCDFNNFTAEQKGQIEADIHADFDNAYKGVLQLPEKARFGVYVAYKYYLSLFTKIKRLKPAGVLAQRTRIPNYLKMMIILRAGLKNQLRLI